jgi:hypothetical protein
MLKLVSSSQLMKARAHRYLQRLMACVNIKSLLLVAMFASMAHAQNVNIPSVDIDGVDEDTNGADIVIVIVKFIAKIVIWGAMGFAGFVALKTILKSWNEQKHNEQGRWAAVIGDSLGSVIMVILVILVGNWVLKFFN